MKRPAGGGERAAPRMVLALVVFQTFLSFPVCAQAASAYTFLDLTDPAAVHDVNGAPLLTFARLDANDVVVWTRGFRTVDDWCAYAQLDPNLAAGKTQQAGWALTGGDEAIFWPLQALLYVCPAYRSIVATLESSPLLYDPFADEWVVPCIELTDKDNVTYQPTGTVRWNPTIASVFDRSQRWHSFPPLVGLAHELVHAQQRVLEDKRYYTSVMQIDAMKGENVARFAFHRKAPGYGDLRPRPGNQGFYRAGNFQFYFEDIDWADWSPAFNPLLDVFEEQ